MDGLHFRVNVLKAVQAQVEAGKFNADETRRFREMTLTVGTVGRLLMTEEIAEVLPLEDEEALQAANPVQDGVVRRDEAKIAARQKAMAANLPKEGMAVVILGGDHDLTRHLPGVLYVRVTPRSYPE